MPATTSLNRQASMSELQDEPWHCEALSVVVFGASGDLAKKKTYPALFAVYTGAGFPIDAAVVGYARSESTDEAFRTKLKPFIMKSAKNVDEKKVDEFLAMCYYHQGQYDSANSVREMGTRLESIHANGGRKCEGENRLFYLALPPSAFVSTSRSIKDGGLTTRGWNRVVVEKPFGRDTESAVKLGNDLGEIFTEEYLYRIDHYLAKEMTQNLIVLRFGNTFLEPIWNRLYVSAVQISFKEDIGTYGRGGYFDESGIIRDVIQNHLIQVLSIVCMEPPTRVSGGNYANYVRDEKVKVLRSIKPFKKENVVLGQYTRKGDEPGYLEDETVPKGSKTPTFATCYFTIDNARWEGVPFIIKAGKALDDRRTEIRIQLKPPPGAEDMFNGEDTPRNELVIRLQPNEAIYLKTNVKKPGLHTVPVQSELDLTYESRYPIVELADAYTRLLLDVIRGKQAIFVRDDELLEAWRIVTPLLHMIEKGEIEPRPYEFGSRGPPESDALIKKVGFVVNDEYRKDWQAQQQKKDAAKM